MIALQKNLNALIILTIVGILIAAFGVQFIWNEQPCPLCMLQRLGMISVAASLLLNIRFGIRPTHYGLALFSSLMGGFVALRQISLHVCPGLPEFGMPVLGLSLYTWSFIIFACCVFAVGILLCLYNPKKIVEQDVPMNWLCRFAFVMLLLITIANIITTFSQCGLGICEDV